MTLVILAAGRGSRYGGLKQMDPIGPSGELIIDYSVYDAVCAGFDKVVFIIKKEIEDDFRNTIGKRIEKKIKVDYVFQCIEDLPEGYTVAFIHKNTGYTNYIIREDWGRYKTYYWISSFEPQQVFVPEDFGLHNMIYNFQDSLQDQAVYEINALGNTLIMLVDNGVHYFLFKENR